MDIDDTDEQLILMRALMRRHTNLALEELIRRYNEPGRFYHNFLHVMSLFRRAKSQGIDLAANTNLHLALAILFHDVVYVPGSPGNEAASASLAEQRIKDPATGTAVSRAITFALDNDKPSRLRELDYGVFGEGWDAIAEYDRAIFQEFQRFDYASYKQKRVEFLNTVEPSRAIERLKDHYRLWKPNIGFYAGSFNRFHKGHLNILQKAEKMFDKVIVAQGFNPAKTTDVFDINNVRELLWRQRVQYQTTLPKAMQESGDNLTLIRGIRSVTDMPDEIALYRYLQDIDKNIKVVHIICDAEFEHLSSSTIRGLTRFGLDERYLVT